MFGNETLGMPEKILEKHPAQCFRIPMDGAVRSLNLATAVGIVLAAKELERIADLCTNLAEDVVFMAEGTNLKHEGKM